MMLIFTVQPFEQLTLNEFYRLCQVRTQVFIIEQTCCYQEFDGIDSHAWHLQGFIKDKKDEKQELACYARIIPPNYHPASKLAIGRVLTVEKFRGQGVARKLMLQAIQFCHAHYPNLPIYISAQCYLIEFYQSLGFVTQGERYLEDGIAHIDMILDDKLAI